MLNEYKNLLKEFISFKSISTDPTYTEDIKKTAQWLGELFKKNNFTVHLLNGYGNPIVVARYEVNPNFDTCLIYGHYDVQPAEKIEGWKSEPFQLTEKDNKLLGRGIVDNKGQVMIHIATVLSLIKEKKLGYNILFFIEGDEETGSALLEKALQDNKKLLQADFSIVSDGEMNLEYPSFDAGFRGGFNATLTISTSSTDLHSGLYGGVVPNAAHEMSYIIQKCINGQTNEVLIPHFYDGVETISLKLLKNNRSIPFSEIEFKKLAGIKHILKRKKYDVYTTIGLIPTIQITGLQSGYVGEGYRNSIPAQATAKLNVRTVPKQDNQLIIKHLQHYLEAIIPSYITYSLEISEPYDGIKIDYSNKHAVKAKSIIQKIYGKEPLYKYSGGGIPIVTYFQNLLKMHNILFPFGNEDCQMHAVNENFKLEYIKKGLEFSHKFLSKLDK